MRKLGRLRPPVNGGLFLAFGKSKTAQVDWHLSWNTVVWNENAGQENEGPAETARRTNQSYTAASFAKVRH
jgi:hypothetical protein